MRRLRTWLAIEVLLPAKERRVLRAALDRYSQTPADREREARRRAAQFHGLDGGDV